ncbi:DUF4240 domain-containing protein [Bacteroides ovatus]|nr:DUF4240 domain-containing protein [Bacteroides ovatus]
MPADGESEGLKLDRNMFWDVIDSTNAAGPYPDQETWRCRMTAALEKHTMEEILDWQLILEEYMQSACRQDILAAAAARGVPCLGDGFSQFRAWLIAGGEEVYRNVLGSRTAWQISLVMVMHSSSRGLRWQCIMPTRCSSSGTVRKNSGIYTAICAAGPWTPESWRTSALDCRRGGTSQTAGMSGICPPCFRGSVPEGIPYLTGS